MEIGTNLVKQNTYGTQSVSSVSNNNEEIDNSETAKTSQETPEVNTDNTSSVLTIEEMTLDEINALSMQGCSFNDTSVSKDEYSAEDLKAEGFIAHYLLSKYFDKSIDSEGNEKYRLKQPLSVSGKEITSLQELRDILNIQTFDEYIESNCSSEPGSLLKYFNDDASSYGHLGKEGNNNTQVNADTYEYCRFYDFLATALNQCASVNGTNGGLYGHFHKNNVCDLHLDEEALAVALVNGGYLVPKGMQNDIREGVVYGVKYDYTIGELDNAVMAFLNDLGESLGKSVEELSVSDLVKFYCETQPGTKKELERNLYKETINNSAAFDVYGNSGYDPFAAGCDVNSFFYKILGPRANIEGGSMWDKLTDWINQGGQGDSEVRDCIFKAAGINENMNDTQKLQKIQALCQKAANEIGVPTYCLSDFMLFDYLMEHGFVDQKTYTKEELSAKYKFTEEEINKYFYVEKQDESGQDVYKMRRDIALEEKPLYHESVLYEKIDTGGYFDYSNITNDKEESQIETTQDNQKTKSEHTESEKTVNTENNTPTSIITEEAKTEQTVSEVKSQRAATESVTVTYEYDYTEKPEVTIKAEDYETKREKLVKKKGLIAIRGSIGMFLFVKEGSRYNYIYNPITENFEIVFDNLLSNDGRAIDRKNPVAIKLEAMVLAQKLGLNFTVNYPFVCEKDGVYYYYDKKEGTFKKH